ncbi:hypothetical protein I7331_24400 [Frankia sp. AgB1.8]|nr:hypothetical protein [Frankia sp. AgB1.8]
MTDQERLAPPTCRATRPSTRTFLDVLATGLAAGGVGIVATEISRP